MNFLLNETSQKNENFLNEKKKRGFIDRFERITKAFHRNQQHNESNKQIQIRRIDYKLIH